MPPKRDRMSTPAVTDTLSKQKAVNKSRQRSNSLSGLTPGSSAALPQVPEPKLDITKKLSTSGTEAIQEDLLNTEDITDNSPEVPEKRRKNKSECPCSVSTQGTAWKIVCITCAQTWHTSCCNLKGASLLPKKDVLSLTKDWDCPWCYICPFDKRTGHSSKKNSALLLNNEICASVATVIEDKLVDLIKTHNKPDFEGIQDKLGSLTKLVDSMKTTSHLNHQPHIPQLIKQPLEPTKVETQCPEDPIFVQKNDYLSSEKAQGLQHLMANLKADKLFKPKKGRSTLTFGAAYEYSGAKDKPHSTDIPAELLNLVDKIKEDFNLPEDKVPNSILINLYPAKSKAADPASSLPKHSDNEIEIDPDSNIYTYSIGCSRNIVFSKVHESIEDNATVHAATDNSLYVMSRASQAWFSHQITDADTCGERFSVTLRKINSLNTRSTLIIGDSNSKDIKFGSGRGFIGEKYPGKRVKSAKIKDINPADCVAYSNVVLTCGTNDLRVTEVDTDNPEVYINNLVVTLKQKCQQISLLSNANIILMPVLPSRDANMNKYICYFNSQVFNSEFRHDLNITMPPIYSFLDSNQKLNIDLTRNGDLIHLGSHGISKFVSIIKEAIFYCEKNNAQKTRSGHKKGQGRGPAQPS